uniref:Uncharacterized protein n=1 Tax=Nicotiana tabacum TaxID=4097 RepID=A0A1S4BBG6_TOBAC|nr:PREDICTED: uncharacterized protein LOC107806512 [Nicotiana tabacum]
MEFFQSWQIKRITLAPYHSVADGQAESTNKVIINNLKKRLEESKAKTCTGETPFFLVYGVKASILVEIGEPSMRYIQATEESNDEEMRVNLDLLEERRETTLIRMAAQKQIIERYHDRKAHLRGWLICGTLVICPYNTRSKNKEAITSKDLDTGVVDPSREIVESESELKEGSKG